jgi:hypothetical protein
MNKLSRALANAPHHLWTLVEHYRDARKRAKIAREEHARIADDGRYHLDGVTPHSVREDSSFHEEKLAALAVADSIVRHVEDHEAAASRPSGERRWSRVSGDLRPSEC